MAIYSFRQSMIGASGGKSPVGSAAYRHSARMGFEDIQSWSYTHKDEVIHSELVLPRDGPEWADELGAGHKRTAGRSSGEAMENSVVGPDAIAASEALWKRIVGHETRRDAQYGREVIVALPRELEPEENVALVREFIDEHYTRRGIVADWAYHDAPGNPHAHIASTLRPLTRAGFGPKTHIARDASGEVIRTRKGAIVYAKWAGGREELAAARELWEVTSNLHLARAGHEARIDHRSNEARGIATVPTHHRGPAVEAMQRANEETEVGEDDRAYRDRQFERFENNPQLVIDHVAKEHSTFTDEDIARVVWRYAPNKDRARRLMMEVGTLDTVIPIQTPMPNPVTGRDEGTARYTVMATLEREEAMIASARSRYEDRSFHVDDGKVGTILERVEDAQGFAFSGEQRAAIEHTVRSNGLSVIAGYAGAGKSTVMGAVREVYEAEGRRVVGGALAGKAARGLTESAGIEARTLASWEHGWKRADEAMAEAKANGTAPDPRALADRLAPGSVFVLDEAGMVASAQMGRIAGRLDQMGAKLVLVGDARQLQPIEAGAAFRSIAMDAGYSELIEIRRQRTDWQAEASVAFARGDAVEGLAAYVGAGDVRFERDRDQARMTVLSGWHRHYTANAETIMLAHTNRDVRALNEGARAIIKADGGLSRDELIETAKGHRQMAVGERIVFLRNDRQLGVQNGRLGTIEAIEHYPQAGYKVRHGDEHSEEVERPKPTLVVRLDGEAADPVRVDLDAYADIDHGYATTIHKAQGATVDHVHVLATGMMDAQLSYVAMTRHRQDVSMTVALDTFRPHGPAVKRGEAKRGEPLGEKRAVEKQAVAKLSRERVKDTTVDYENTPDYQLSLAELRRLRMTPTLASKVDAFCVRRGLTSVVEARHELSASIDALRSQLRGVTDRFDRVLARARSLYAGRPVTGFAETLDALRKRAAKDRVSVKEAAPDYGAEALAIGQRFDGTAMRDGPTPAAAGRLVPFPEITSAVRRSLGTLETAWAHRSQPERYDGDARVMVAEQRYLRAVTHEMSEAVHAPALRRFNSEIASIVPRELVLRTGPDVEAAALALAYALPAMDGGLKERVLANWPAIHAGQRAEADWREAGRTTRDRTGERPQEREASRNDKVQNEQFAPARTTTAKAEREASPSLTPSLTPSPTEREPELPFPEIAPAPPPSAAVERPASDARPPAPPASPTPLIRPTAPLLFEPVRVWPREPGAEAGRIVRHLFENPPPEHDMEGIDPNHVLTPMRALAKEVWIDPKRAFEAVQQAMFNGNERGPRLAIETLRHEPERFGELQGRMLMGRVQSPARSASRSAAISMAAHVADAAPVIVGHLREIVPAIIEQRRAFRHPMPDPSPGTVKIIERLHPKSPLYAESRKIVHDALVADHVPRELVRAVEGVVHEMRTRFPDIERGDEVRRFQLREGMPGVVHPERVETLARCAPAAGDKFQDLQRLAARDRERQLQRPRTIDREKRRSERSR